jgi:hypothetical protein
MGNPSVDDTVKRKVLEIISAESEKQQEKGGWVSGIYPKLKQFGFNDWQIRNSTSNLVSEGRLVRQGEGSRSQWKPVQIPEGEKPDVPEEEIITSEESIIAEAAEPTDDDLIGRIERRLVDIQTELDKLQQEEMELQNVREVILGSKSARERAKSLPAI